MSSLADVNKVQSQDSDLEDRGRLIALAGLPDIKSDQLGRLLRRHGLDPLWRLLVGGHRVRTRNTPASARAGQLPLDDPDRADLADDDRLFLPVQRANHWGAQLRAANPLALAMQHQRAGVQVLSILDPNFPVAFTRHRSAPGVLFVRGNRSVLEGGVVEGGVVGAGDPGSVRRVAIVGTRQATPYGRQVARSFGRTLAAHGVSVVSGLAAGIDGSAHAGTLADRRVTDAPPIAVVGSGLDRIYPYANRELWAAVEQHGVVVSEWPMGTKPLPWHFPARNRLIVALSEAVVVVESAEKGGSMLTVTYANQNGVPVLAVPGPITSSVSAGTNGLLSDGASVLCQGAYDVLRQLSLTKDTAGVVHAPPDTRRPPDQDGTTLLRFLGWDVLTIDGLLARMPGVESGMLLLTLHELEFDGWVARGSDGWFQLAPRG